MSIDLVIESFCYGNIKNLSFMDGMDDSFCRVVIDKLKRTIKDRSLESLWSIVNNIKIIADVHSYSFLVFVKEIFNIIDSFFNSNYNDVSFDNPAILKSFIINNLAYAIEAYSFSEKPVDDKNKEFYSKNFKEIIDYIEKFKITTNYNIPSTLDDKWIPKWKIDYKDNDLSTSNIDIYIDNFIIDYNVKYMSNMTDILEKVEKRLRYLKQKAPFYFKYINDYLGDFSKYVFQNYPYYEIVKHYEKLLSISEQIYIPEGYCREDFKQTEIMFSILPKTFVSYILGFPVTTMGVLPDQIVREFILSLKKDKATYFKNLEEKNDNFIKSKMFIKKCGNNIEDNDILNLIYTPVKSYNSDDTIVLFSNGVYFVFNYPEYDNILKTESNPYNRAHFEFKYISSFSFAKSMKKDMIKEIRIRGLEMDLNDTIEKNLEELEEKIKFFKPFQSNYTSNTLLNLVFSHFREDFAS